MKSSRPLWITFLVLCAIGAAVTTRRIIALQSTPLGGTSELAQLDEHFAAKTTMTLVHVVPSLLFVLLVPLQFISSLRSGHPELHRWIGRITMCLSFVIGVSALWLSTQPVGGVIEASATIFFGCFFLFCLGKAWWHIRNRRIVLHREWVTRMVAIALGVATTRPIMGVFFATSRITGLTPQQFFGPAMWLGLTSTYLAGEWINRAQARKRS